MSDLIRFAALKFFRLSMYFCPRSVRALCPVPWFCPGSVSCSPPTPSETAEWSGTEDDRPRHNGHRIASHVDIERRKVVNNKRADVVGANKGQKWLQLGTGAGAGPRGQGQRDQNLENKHGSAAKMCAKVMLCVLLPWLCGLFECPSVRL